MSSADMFANSLDPDLARQNIGPDLDTNDVLKEFFEKVDFEINQQNTTKKSMQN